MHRLPRSPRTAALAGLLLATLLATAPPAARACDVCAVYSSVEARESLPGPYVGLFAQATAFRTLREDGEEVPNPTRQKLDSTRLQAIFGWQLSDRLGVQVNVPWLDRSWRRPEHDGVETRSESGLGDLSALARVRLWQTGRENGFFVLGAVVGVEGPTGDSDRLAEEAAEDHPEAETQATPLPSFAQVPGTSVQVAGTSQGGKHGGAGSGVHGHDLALGSGSWDGIVGLNAFGSHGRLFASGETQLALRGAGDHGYRFADDLTAALAVGGYVWLTHEHALSLAARVSGEWKGEDEQDGERSDDTALRAIWAGPAASWSAGRALSVELGYELPVSVDGSGLQLTADRRLRLAVVWRGL